ncbi:MAG TPA: threonine synthase [Gammaproteobacteria bacterium]|nr:threonine synthase [Gammaproteobacteria bacterium]
MSYRLHLRCSGCGERFPPDTIMNLCPRDRRPVEIVLDIDRLAADRPGAAWYRPERRNMWRFGGLLALDYDDPADRRSIVTCGEGHTPLLDLHDLPQARQHGFCLWLKEEGMPMPGYGANPTLSFKDRGMAMTVSMARALGLGRLAVPTQGNAGDSLSTYAVHAGLAAAVVMPADTPLPILERVAALSKTNPGIRLDLVQGTIREAAELVERSLVAAGYFNAAALREPGWRIEGKKTLGLEIAEPRNGMNGDDWSLPDTIVFPTGGGTGIIGMWKAFAELEALGLADSRRPRFIAVQSESTAPIVEAFDAGRDDTVPVTPRATLATGLNVPGGQGHLQVLKILRESGGAALAVSEQAIADTLAEFHRARRWRIGPEGAATLAVLDACVERKLIRRGERVVCVNTGAFEKYWPDLRQRLDAGAAQRGAACKVTCAAGF